MPILIPAPGTTPPPPPPPPPGDFPAVFDVVAPPPLTRRLGLAAPGSGDVLWLDRSAGLLARWGSTGLGAPPRDVLTTEATGELLPHLEGLPERPAEVFLPLLVEADTAPGLVGALEGLTDLTRGHWPGFRADDGTVDLVAAEGGSVRRRRCVYRSGLEDAAPGEWASVGLSLVAVWPWWVGDPWETEQVRVPDPRPFVTSDDAYYFGSLYLVASRALGEDLPLVVRGTAPSPPVVELWGPASSVTIESPAGLSLVIGDLDEGDHLVIDTRRARRVELNGGGPASGWPLVARGAQIRPLPPGGSTVSVVIEDATEASAARVWGDSLFHFPWPSGG